MSERTYTPMKKPTKQTSTTEEYAKIFEDYLVKITCPANHV